MGKGLKAIFLPLIKRGRKRRGEDCGHIPLQWFKYSYINLKENINNFFICWNRDHSYHLGFTFTFILMSLQISLHFKYQEYAFLSNMTQVSFEIDDFGSVFFFYLCGMTKKNCIFKSGNQVSWKFFDIYFGRFFL